MQPVADRPMPLVKALHILVSVHTKEDDRTGFCVIAGAAPDQFNCGPAESLGDYIEARKVVRQAPGVRTDP